MAKKSFEEIFYGDFDQAYYGRSGRGNSSASSSKERKSFDEIFYGSSETPRQKEKLQGLDDYIDYGLEKAGQGMLQGAKGLGDLALNALDNPLSALAAIPGTAVDFVSKIPGVDQRVKQSFDGLRESAAKADQHIGIDTSKLKTGFDAFMQKKIDDTVTYDESNLNGAQQLYGNVAEGIGGMLPSMATSLVNPSLGMAVLAGGAAGNATEEALADGASIDDALAYGLSSGAVEIATEKMFGGIPLLGSGWFDDVAKPWLNQTLKSEAGKQLVKYVQSSLGEGFEEYVSEIAGEYLTDLYKEYEGDENALQRFISTQPDALYSALVGTITGAIMGTPGAVNDARNADKNNAAPEPLTNQEQTAEVAPIKEDGTAKTADEMIQEMNENAGKIQAQQFLNQQPVVEKTSAEQLAEGLKSNDVAIKMAAQMDNEQNIHRSATRYHVDGQTARRVTEAANGLGVRVEFVDSIENGAEGMYKNGTLYISKDTMNPVHEVFKHELTHHLEQTGSYKQFQQTMFKLAEKQGYDVNKLSQTVKERYAAADEMLDDERTASEVTAILTQDKIFTDQGTINDLAKLDLNLAQRILKWIQEKIYSFSEKTESRALMLKAERLYRTAIKEAQKQTVQQDKQGQYLIAKTKSGEDVAVADQLSFTNKNFATKQAVQTVKDTILKYIPHQFRINSDGNIVSFNQQSADEYLYSKSAQRLYKAAPKLLKGKNIIAGNLGEVIAIAKNGQLEQNQKGIHVNDSSIGKRGFYHYDTLFAIPVKDSNNNIVDYYVYEADLVLDNNADGNAYFYDLVNIKKSDLQLDKKSMGPTVVGNRSLSNNSIYNFGQKSSKSMGLSAGELSTDSEGRNLTSSQQQFFKDSKILDNDGHLKVMYHGSPNSDITEFNKKYTRSSGYYGRGFYFSDTKGNVGIYANNGKIYEVYLNIENPLQLGDNRFSESQIRNFVTEIAESDDYGIDNYGYGATIDSVVKDLMNKGDDFSILSDINASCIGDFVETVNLFNEINGTNYDGIVVPTETVAFYPEQIKLVTNENPTSSRDIRYSRGLNADNLADPATQDNIDKKVSGYKQTRSAAVKKINGGFAKGNMNSILDQIATELVNTGSYPIELRNALIDDVWGNAYSIDSSKLDAYEGVREYLKDTPLKLTDSAKAEIVDWPTFRKSVSRKLRFSNDGQSIDSVYQELKSLYGEVFPEVNSEGEMLEVMADVYDYEQSKQVHLSEYGVKKEDFAKDIDDVLVEFGNQVVYRSDKRYMDAVARKANQHVKGSLADLATSKYREFERDVEEILKENEENYGYKSKADWLSMAPQMKNYGTISKTLSQVLDIVANKNPELRVKLYDALERPLYEAKSGYTRNLKSNVNKIYDEVVKKYGIKKGSKESAALMWYGEGKRPSNTNSKGEEVFQKYTLADLQKDFPARWENIVAADKVMRKMYDDYIDRLNATLELIYPNVEAHAKFELDKAKANIATYEKLVNDYIDQGKDNGIPSDRALYNDAMRELTSARTRYTNLKKTIENKDYFRNKRVLKRQDYYHHFSEMQMLKSLKDLFDSNASNNISNQLAGKSEFTKPKARWAGFMQKQGYGSYTEDAVAAMLDYIPKAEYKIAFDPVVNEYRDSISKLVEASNAQETDNTKFIQWMTDYTNDLAGKTNPLDRVVTRFAAGRTVIPALRAINSRVKANAIVGNLNSAVSQFFNLPNSVGVIKQKGGIKFSQDFAKGFADYSKYTKEKLNGNSSSNVINQSVFLSERYMDEIYNRFEDGFVSNLNKSASWILTIGDKAVAEYTWFAAYNQAQRLGVDNPIEYADNLVRKAVAGRGIGELPLTQKSEIVKLLAPFQVEVANTWQLMQELTGLQIQGENTKSVLKNIIGGDNRDLVALLGIFVTTWLMNQINEAITGNRVGMDLIDAIKDALENWDKEKNLATNLFSSTGRVAGEILSNAPAGNWGTTIAGIADYDAEKLFGEADPTKYGTSNMGAQALFDPFVQLMTGQNIDWQSTITNFATPFGGKQLNRVYKMAEDAGIIPRIDFNTEDGLIVNGYSRSTDKEEAKKQPSEWSKLFDTKPGAYNDKGQLKYQVDTSDPWNMARGFAFGTYATDQGKEYIDKEWNAFSEKKTVTYENMVKAGADPMDAYNALRAANQFKNVKDKDGNSIENSMAALNREALEDAGVFGFVEKMVNSGDYTYKDFGLNKTVFDMSKWDYEEFLKSFKK